MTNLHELVETVRAQKTRTRFAIAGCESEPALSAAALAVREGLATPVLVGNPDQTEDIAHKLGLDISGLEFHQSDSDVDAVTTAIGLFKQGKVDMLMKGATSTKTLLKAMLNKTTGVPPKGLLSLVGVFEAPPHNGDASRLMLLSDPGINIRPNLQRRVDIIKNSVLVARCIGMDAPKVALLTAAESLNPAIASTVDAKLLTMMSEQGEFDRASVLGPLSLDLAVSPSAARHKRYDHPVAGHADILVAPDIESGNILYKCLTSLLQVPMAVTVVGSRMPTVLTSRGDSDETRLRSLALTCYLSRFST